MITYFFDFTIPTYLLTAIATKLYNDDASET